ncbi:response regulator [Candidatus Pacearchaeota archaeon]|jgi:response regulator of citrate/malate metabolism|nr:response regulator [Candidatus Pacearchaeota archaeon]|tara:strand:+ start:44 stop:403 length:360 start_codon:yes stop_codon:yes gene_type:complete
MKKVLLVGNCNFDGHMIKDYLESNFNVEVVLIDTIENAKKSLENKLDLIMVNRIGELDNKNGLELIDYVKEQKIKTPIMLITNYEDSMNEAIKHGGVMGFGKDNLNSKKTGLTLKKYLK